MHGMENVKLFEEIWIKLGPN